MSNMVRPTEFGRDHGLIHEAVVTGRKVGAGRSFWSGLAHDEAFFAEVLELARRFGYGGLFISAAEQLELVKQRNQERGWGFAEEDFAALGEPPAWPEGELCAVVLDAPLATVEQTFEQAWQCVASVYEDKWRWEALLSDAEHLRLLPSIQHKRGLRWRIVDLAANWDKQNGLTPAAIRPQSGDWPSSAILWAASYFPQWVQAMDGVNVPYVWISGYQATVSGDPAWSFVPGLSFDRGDRRVRLSALGAGDRHSRWAVPCFRE